MSLAFDLSTLREFKKPYRHWISKQFLSPEVIREINATWPAETEADWLIEQGKFAKKGALMFPRPLHDAAQRLAVELYSPEVCKELSDYVGIELVPDPWFTEGPLVPRLGGGLHEIHPGGLLKMHCDFDKHPSGLRRIVNLLVYLNEDWKDEWGGALELHGSSEPAVIPPRGGTAVLFVTDGQSWHGHPKPLACPPNRTRRSLALYYYTASDDGSRLTTVYRK